MTLHSIIIAARVLAEGSLLGVIMMSRVSFYYAHKLCIIVAFGFLHWVSCLELPSIGHTSEFVRESSPQDTKSCCTINFGLTTIVDDRPERSALSVIYSTRRTWLDWRVACIVCSEVVLEAMRRPSRGDRSGDVPR